MNDLTARQINILKKIIEEYIDTAEAVGSEKLDKKYNLGVSPATLRNEMVALTDKGFLKQGHTSAGRTPTPKALRYYVSSLMQPQNLSVAEEVKIKEKVSDYKKEFEKVLRQATVELAETTKSLAVASDTDGDIYYSGAAHILDMPECYDIDLTRNLLSLLDHFDYLNKIFSQTEDTRVTHVMLGDDLGSDLASYAMVFQHFGLGGKRQGTIGIIGPYRLNYPRLVPAVNYFGGLIDEFIAV
jgi:heat-inducible transcriptional repressor